MRSFPTFSANKRRASAVSEITVSKEEEKKYAPTENAILEMIHSIVGFKIMYTAQGLKLQL